MLIGSKTETDADLLWGRAEGRDQLGHDGFDFRVALVQMFGQRAHEDDHALPHRVIAGVLRRALQKLLKHGQQSVHVILTDREISLLLISCIAGVLKVYIQRSESESSSTSKGPK